MFTLFTNHISSGQFLISLAATIEAFFCTIFYARHFPLKKRNHLRILLAVLLILMGIFCISFIRSFSSTLLTSSLTGYLRFGIFFLVLVLLFNESISELLLTLCAGIATQILVGRIYEIILLCFGLSPYHNISPLQLIEVSFLFNWIFYYALHIVLAFLFSCFFNAQNRTPYRYQHSRFVVFFSISFTLISYPLNSYSRSLEGVETNLDMVIRCYSMLFAITVLFIRTGFLEKSHMEVELSTITEALRSDRKEYEMFKSEIDIINMKCHDLKHALSSFEGRITSEELETLKEAVTIYDESIHTGNPILDVVLYKKTLLCEKENIQFTYIANGSCLSEFSTSHLYSLLNNALENAIEAVQKLPQEKRIISLTISEENGLIAFHVTNYFDGTPVKINSPLSTQKQDYIHHGLGMRSIRYIVDQYDGHMNYHSQGDIFFLDLYFPL